MVVDTGGLERHPDDPIEEKVQEQARLAIGEADVIVFVVDADAGEVPADLEAAEILRTAASPILVAANKADNPKRELEAAEFHRLGWEETYSISALHGRGVADLLDAIVWALPPEPRTEIERKRVEAAAEQAAEEALALGEEAAAAESRGVRGRGSARVVRIAIVGRPNVGKSSLLNKLLGEERAIVSDIPGTTRDAIDTSLDWNGHAGPPGRHGRHPAARQGRQRTRGGEVLDAARGARRRARGRGGARRRRQRRPDRPGRARGRLRGGGGDRPRRRDQQVGPGREDRHARSTSTSARIRADTPFLDFAPIVAISAKTGQRVGRVLDAALEIAAGRRRARSPRGSSIASSATPRSDSRPRR